MRRTGGIGVIVAHDARRAEDAFGERRHIVKIAEAEGITHRHHRHARAQDVCCGQFSVGKTASIGQLEQGDVADWIGAEQTRSTTATDRKSVV